MGAMTSGCIAEKDATGGRRPAYLQTLYNGGYKVEVVATSIGGVPGVRAYHTSVLIDGIEYSFGPMGVTKAPGLPSHMCLADKPKVTWVGLTCVSADAMMQAVGPYFKKGSYDLLRKNCNSFSDCSLYCLLDMRLDPKYRGLEKIGASADKKTAIVQALANGSYRPNPEADNFDVERVVQKVSKIKSSWGIR